MFSQLIHGNPRAGLAPPVVLHEAIESVLVQGLKLFELGHNYFGNAARLLHDIHLVFRYELEAKRRPSLSFLVEPSGIGYWGIDLRE